jgi:hypothetical protein
MAQYQDQPDAQHRNAEFEARHDLGSGDVARDAGNKDMPNTLIEDQFRRDAGIGTGKHRGEGFLRIDRMPPQDGKISIVNCETAGHKALVSTHQLPQRVVRTQLGLSRRLRARRESQRSQCSDWRTPKEAPPRLIKFGHTGNGRARQSFRFIFRSPRRPKLNFARFYRKS